MYPRQNDMSGHVANHMRFVCEARRAEIAGPSIGLDGGAGSDAIFEEGSQAGGRGVFDCRQTDAARPLPLDFDGGGDLEFSFAAAPAAPSRGSATIRRPSSGAKLYNICTVAGGRPAARTAARASSASRRLVPG